MISLNLISPQQKHLLKMDRTYQLAKNLLAILVLFSIILAIFLIPLNKRAKKLEQAIVYKKGEVELKNKNLAEKINLLNQEMDLITKIQAEFFDWSNYLIELSKLVPQKISLNQLANDLSSHEVNLRGYAQTRDDLIKFKENLESSPLFYEVKIPLSNFLTPEAITFEINAKFSNLENLDL